jgi:hypothetical protein
LAAVGCDLQRFVEHGPDAVMIVAVHAAGEGDARAGRNAQVGLGPAAGGEVVAAVDHRGGEGAVIEDGIGCAHGGLHGRSLDPQPSPLAVGKGRSAAEDEARRLFCFALQSRGEPGGGK